MAKQAALIAGAVAVGTSSIVVDSDRSDAYNLIGTGCHYLPNRASLNFNQNTADGGDGQMNVVATWATENWRKYGHEGPVIWAYWPGPPVAGQGDFELRSYGNAQSVNSGYTSTVGPSSWAAPTCGSQQWASKPHVWLNYDRIVQNEAAGHNSWSVATAAHELGHVLGLDHTEGNPSTCSPMPLMDAHASHGNNCNVWYPTADEINGVNKIYN